MVVGLIGILDLSIVTDRLIGLIDDAVANTPLWGGGGAPFTLSVNGSMPESVRTDGDGGCQLSVYLFHVARDPSQAAPISGTWYGSADAYLGMDAAVQVRRQPEAG